MRGGGWLPYPFLSACRKEVLTGSEAATSDSDSFCSVTTTSEEEDEPCHTHPPHYPDNRQSTRARPAWLPACLPAGWLCLVATCSPPCSSAPPSSIFLV